MNAREKTETLRDRLARRGIALSHADAHTLRRAELTLSRWHERECGTSTDYAGFCVERDADGTPYECVYPHAGKARRYRTPDLERGALRRVAGVCERNGLRWYMQGDPRGCALYVAREPLDGRNYSAAGVPCCA